MPPIPIDDDQRIDLVTSIPALFEDWRRTRMNVIDYVRSHRSEVDHHLNVVLHGRTMK